MINEWAIRVVLCAWLLLSPLAPLAPADSTEYVGHWRGTLAREGQVYPVAVNVSRDNGQLSATIDFPDYSVYGCPTEFTLADGRFRLRAKLVEAQLSGQLSKNRIEGSAQLLGNLQATLALDLADRTPITYAYDDVQFKSADAVLSGTLVKPGNFSKGRRLPVVIWTHGSGPDTRRTFYYHGRAHLLAQHGIASLIYDKRGAGESTGGDSWNHKKLTEDALAAVVFVARRSDIDRSGIGVAGFSQGGWIAPAVAAASTDVDFVLVGATPGITGGEQNLFTLENRLVDQGFDASEVRAAIHLMRRIYEFYQTGEGREEVESSMHTAKQARWFIADSFQRMLFMPDSALPQGRHPYWQPFSPDPMAPWRQIRVPVLSVWGELDRQVPAALSKNRIESALHQAQNSDYELIIFPSASHGLWVVRDDKTPWDWPRQVPGYHQTIVRWVISHTE